MPCAAGPRSRSRIAFASELRALVAAGLTTRELDWQALDSYFELGYIPAPMSPFPSGGSIPLPIAFKLLALLFAPRGGRSLRTRLRRMLRTEGIGGIARRLRRHEG